MGVLVGLRVGGTCRNCFLVWTSLCAASSLPSICFTDGAFFAASRVPPPGLRVILEAMFWEVRLRSFGFGQSAVLRVGGRWRGEVGGGVGWVWWGDSASETHTVVTSSVSRDLSAGSSPAVARIGARIRTGTRATPTSTKTSLTTLRKFPDLGFVLASILSLHTPHLPR